MPKKTKQQKILADKHHHVNSSSMVFSYTAKSVNNSVKPADTINFTLIKKDILKTMLLAIIFIAAEIGLSIYSKKLGW